METNSAKQFVTIRISKTVADEVKRIASREDETQSTILRRLLRDGLKVQHRGSDPQAA
jgi:predicted transcriptional regulator